MTKYRVGIIGCGLIFNPHALALSLLPDVEVKAVCDIKPEAVKRASALFGCDACSDYHDLLKRPDIDVIHVLTPHYLHAPMVIAAADAGKHVLTEKPMAIRYEDACAEVEAGRRNGVTVGVISQNRYNSASVAIKEAIASGSLGKVISQRVLLTWAKPESYYQNSDWRGTWDKEGGSLMIDQAIHVMDLARWFVDDDISQVEATLTNRLHPYIQTEDTAEGLIQYRHGARTVFYATNNLGYDAPTLVETHCERGLALLEFDRAVITYASGKEVNVINNPTEGYDEADYKAFFGEASLTTAMSTLQKWGIVGSPIRWKMAHGAWGMSHIKQITNFYQSLAQGIDPEINGEEALKTQAMMCAIYDSAKERRAIQLA